MIRVILKKTLKIFEFNVKFYLFKIVRQSRVLENSTRLDLAAEPVFAIASNDTSSSLTNNSSSLVWLGRPSPNATYVLQVRCFDAGQPPLFADTHITVRVVDAASREPRVTDTHVELVVVVGSNDAAPGSTSLLDMTGQAVGQVMAEDEDALAANQTLVYSLSPVNQLPDGISRVVVVDKLTGVLRMTAASSSANDKRDETFLYRLVF